MPELKWPPEYDEYWRTHADNPSAILTVLDETYCVLHQFNAEQTPLQAKGDQPYPDQFPQAVPPLLRECLQKAWETGDAQMMETLHVGESPGLYRHDIQRVTLPSGDPVIAVWSTSIPKSSLATDGTNDWYRGRGQFGDERFRLLADHIPAIIIWIDLEETYLYVNQYVANRTGIPQEAFVGRKITDIVKTEESLRQWRDQIADVVQARAPVTVEYTYTWKGMTGHNLITVVPVFDDNGAITSVFSHSVELAKMFEREEALRQAKARAEHAIQVKDRFLAGISHELRTPLNVMVGFAELLRQSDLVQGPLREQVEYIISSGQHLTRLVNDLLNASQIDLNHLQLDVTAVDLYSLIQRSVRTQTARARVKGITLKSEIDPETPLWILGDETRLRQIILNLLDNAIKYTEWGVVSLDVTYDREAQILHLDVLDTGVGIPSSSLNEVFEPFVALGHNQAGTGIGLGLYITRSLVRLMEGEIWAENRPTGGTVFHVQLPLPPTNPAVADIGTELTIPKSLACGNGEYRVLIVEDTPANATMLSQWLTHWGFVVDIARDGTMAMDQIEKQRPDLILLDMLLPGTDGATLAGKIRGREETASTPIIAISATTTAALHERARANGCDDVLTKPVNFRLLARCIETLLGVTFIREPANALSDSGLRRDIEPLSEEDLKSLPSDWLRRMYVASATASPDGVPALILEITDAYPAIAEKIVELMNTFSLSQIADQIERVLNEEL